MAEKEIMSASEAARILGCTAQAVRERIRLGIWDFGECIPKKKTKNKSDTFVIYRRKLYKHMGKTEGDDNGKQTRTA